MLTYAGLQEFKNVKRIGQLDSTTTLTTEDIRDLYDYLKRATDTIDGVTRRFYFPRREVLPYSIPVDYRDLRNRTFPYHDLSLDRDMLEIIRVQTWAGVVSDVGETLSGNLTAIADSFSITDASLYAAGDVLQIDNERLRVLYLDGTTIYVKRGFAFTMPVAHTSGTTIQKLVLTELVPGVNIFPIDWNIYPRYEMRVVWPSSWNGGIGGTAIQSRYPQIFIESFNGYHERYEYDAWEDTGQVVQVGDITATDTTLTVTSAAGTDATSTPYFEVGKLYRIDNELLALSAVDTDADPDELTVLRGQQGAFAEAHTAGTKIYRWNVHDQIREACLGIALTWRDADNSVGGRQGIDETGASVEIALPTDVQKILGRHVRAIIA